jgi:hypothetical protein
MRLAVLFADTRGDDTPTLALPVRKVTIVVDDDVASLTGGLGADDLLAGHNLSGEGGLVLDVDRQRLVIGSAREFSAFLVERLKRREEMLVTTSNETRKSSRPLNKKQTLF